MSQKVIQTKELIEIIMKCIDPPPSQETVEAIITVMSNTIGSALARGTEVRVEKIGTFTLNERGWIRFRPSSTLRERYKIIKTRSEK
jgi:hypothetical protein